MTATFGTVDAMASLAQKRPKVMADSNVVKVSSSRELALVNEHPPSKFVSMKRFFEKIEERKTQLEDDPEKCFYLSFRGVSERDFMAIEECRGQRRLHFRLTHFPDIETLIVKVVSQVHEQTHRYFASELVRRYHDMKMKPTEFFDYGATTTESIRQLPGERPPSKEGDSAFKNKLLRPGEDFPSLVIEAGNSESLPHLRMAAKWWIESTNGRVNIVILINVDTTNKKMTFYKYVPLPPPANFPRLRSTPSLIATKVAKIVVDQSNSPSQISGAPLILEFTAVFNR